MSNDVRDVMGAALTLVQERLPQHAAMLVVTNPEAEGDYVEVSIGGVVTNSKMGVGLLLMAVRDLYQTMTPTERAEIIAALRSLRFDA